MFIYSTMQMDGQSLRIRIHSFLKAWETRKRETKCGKVKKMFIHLDKNRLVTSNAQAHTHRNLTYLQYYQRLHVHVILCQGTCHDDRSWRLRIHARSRFFWIGMIIFEWFKFRSDTSSIIALWIHVMNLKQHTIVLILGHLTQLRRGSIATQFSFLPRESVNEMRCQKVGFPLVIVFAKVRIMNILTFIRQNSETRFEDRINWTSSAIVPHRNKEIDGAFPQEQCGLNYLLKRWFWGCWRQVAQSKYPLETIAQNIRSIKKYSHRKMSEYWNQCNGEEKSRRKEKTFETVKNYMMMLNVKNQKKIQQIASQKTTSFASELITFKISQKRMNFRTNGKSCKKASTTTPSKHEKAR